MNWLGDSRDRNPVQKDSSNEEFVYDRNAYYKYSSLNDRTGRAAPNFTATSPQRSRPTDSTGAMGPGEGNPYYKYKRLVDEDVRYAGKAAPTFSATDSARGVPSGVPPELGNSRFLKYKRLDEEDRNRALQSNINRSMNRMGGEIAGEGYLKYRNLENDALSTASIPGKAKPSFSATNLTKEGASSGYYKYSRINEVDTNKPVLRARPSFSATGRSENSQAGGNSAYYKYTRMDDVDLNRQRGSARGF